MHLQVFNDLKMTTAMEERLSHGISATGFPGNHRTSDFQPPYFPPPFPSQQPTPQEVFAAQNAHLADPYANSLHSFQTSQANMHAAFSYDRGTLTLAYLWSRMYPVPMIHPQPQSPLSITSMNIL